MIRPHEIPMMPDSSVEESSSVKQSKPATVEPTESDSLESTHRPRMLTDD